MADVFGMESAMVSPPPLRHIQVYTSKLRKHVSALTKPINHIDGSKQQHSIHLCFISHLITRMSGNGPLIRVPAR